MTTVISNGNCMLHDIYRSVSFQNACKNHHVLKQYSISDASILRKFIIGFCQHCSDNFLVHKVIKDKVSWVVRGTACKSTEETINRIRVELDWLSDDLICLLLNIESLIDTVVIGNYRGNPTAKDDMRVYDH